jgi:predicted transcriptional regulator of viral defense system
MTLVDDHPDGPLADLAASFTYAEARRAGLSDRRLRALVAAGDVVRLGRGVYRRADAPPVDEDLHEVAARAPDATLCLVTALARHGLSDEIPQRLDVALPRDRRAPKVHAAVAWHRFDPETYQLGREVLDVGDGLTIGLYGPERCVVDAFRLRHREGEEVAIEALRRWLRRPGSTPATLLRLAHHFPHAEPALLAALKVLL